MDKLLTCTDKKMIKEINDTSLFIKILTREDIDKSEYADREIANSNLSHYDFLDKDGPIQIHNKYGEVVYVSNRLHLPSTGDETVSFLVEDNIEAVAEVAELAGNMCANGVHWFRINGQLICEFWYD